VSPGIGLLWFAARREWRLLAIALGATGLLVAVNLVATPDLWPAWVASLQVAGGAPPPYLAMPLPLRCAAAAALLLAGVATDRPWVVPVAAAVSLPFLWLNGLCVALGAAPILRAERRAKATAAGPARSSPSSG
jgi:hypothetical protein